MTTDTAGQKEVSNQAGSFSRDESGGCRWIRNLKRFLNRYVPIPVEERPFQAAKSGLCIRALALAWVATARATPIMEPF